MLSLQGSHAAPSEGTAQTCTGMAPNFPSQSGEPRSLASLQVQMHMLAEDLRAAARAGIFETAAAAEGLAAVIDHAARTFGSAISEEVDLDAV